MSALLAPLLAILCLQAQTDLAITGTVVDARQAPLADVEVFLSFGMVADGAVPVLGRTRTNASGVFRFAIPSREARRGLGRFADVWAYRPGLALGAESTYLLEGSEPEPFALSCGRPASAL